MSNAEIHPSEAMLNRVMIRDNIGLAVLLELKEESPSTVPQHLLVVNAHIHWDPEYCDVKLIQTIMLLNELENILKTAQSERGIGVKTQIPGVPGIPIVLCSDLNSLPDSDVVEYLLGERYPPITKTFWTMITTTSSGLLYVPQQPHLQLASLSFGTLSWSKVPIHKSTWTIPTILMNSREWLTTFSIAPTSWSLLGFLVVLARSG